MTIILSYYLTDPECEAKQKALKDARNARRRAAYALKKLEFVRFLRGDAQEAKNSSGLEHPDGTPTHVVSTENN